MRSPYAYLWSLPSRTLDPDMTRLRGVLAGSAAPTWVVVRGPGTVDRLAEHGVTAVIQERYRVIGEVCGRTVYLRRDVARRPVAQDGRCAGTVLP